MKRVRSEVHSGFQQTESHPEIFRIQSGCEARRQRKQDQKGQPRQTFNEPQPKQPKMMKTDSFLLPTSSVLMKSRRGRKDKEWATQLKETQEKIASLEAQLVQL